MTNLRQHITKPISIAPLVTFRILFGGLMCFGALRFMWSGWIEKLFVDPDFFFKFQGFEWVQVPGPAGLYFLYGLVALSALGIMLGAFCRISTIAFFVSFTYTELLDATNYLNHYYLVCLLAFILIWLPANRAFSLDAWRKPNLTRYRVPAWTIYILLFQIGTVYTFAGLAKLNPDWLFHAMPLAVWLPEHTNLPVLGYFFQFKWTAFLFCWIGAIYDLSVVWLLLFRKTRPWAYALVVLFHALTGLLFNIGLFPLIMVSSTLIFFSADFHRKALSFIGYREAENEVNYEPPTGLNHIGKWALPLFVGIQLLMPFRHWLYPGDVLWTEEGYRFSWRVMLVEKAGTATFTVEDSASSRKSEVINGDYLSLFQEKQMAIQPDFILQFAHFLQTEYEEKHGFKDPIVKVEAHVALNGRSSRPFIDPEVNLAQIQASLAPKAWILRK
ncbi:MAG: HTTM domain-containing protein [Bacteroidetes bacterium]|nr:HTTM domain-containing protein [Bacteroidota bacterium]